MVVASLKLLSEMESASVPSNEHASTTRYNANSSSVRAKCDPAWDHVTEELKDEKSSYRCIHCWKTYKGGGIYRMKRHLAGIKGDVAACMGVPYDVRFQMVENLMDISKSKEQTKKDQEASNYSPLKDSLEFEDVQEITPRGVQLSIKSVLAGKEKKWRVDMVVARWMYDACIPINAVNSSYYQPMFNAVASYGPKYRGPNYHALRVPLLREAKREIQLIVDSHHSYWANTGYTIMTDGWIDTRHRTLINFLVYCPKGIIFIRFVDTSDLVKDVINLSNLSDEIVDWVGPANIVHLIIDNVTNYVATGRILCGKYRNISWSPCAAYCLNLIFKEIGKMDHVAKLAKRAFKITMFIYNHVALQAWLRTRKNWTEIVRPGPTRFATTFIALGSLKEHKHDLQALVTSKFYVESRYAKDKKAKAVVKIILDNQFWNDCHVIMHIMSPLFRLLRIVDSDEKPTMGYVYDGIDIHVAAYWLNPAFQYDSSTLNKRLETQSAVTNVIESKVFSWSVEVGGGIKAISRAVKRKKFNFDPIDYASINKTEFWVVEDEEPPFLDHEEIENALYEEGAYPIEEGSSSHVQRDMDDDVIEDDDDINLESFGNEDDAPPEFRDKNHPIHVEDEEGEDEDDDNDASGGAFGYWLKLDATKKDERESKSEREKENAGQEDLKFEGGKTMRYEFEKLQVMPVSGEMRD
ncbi:uncharacterized protein LOC136063198 [Quercus suber]|uniref:uncharacterized protein LOC136063198 n=1 Tax=Quercus suber TaxID=58331 RepID=UPI0032DF2FC1